MWFGTWNGLNKYDGYTFTTYKPTPGDTESLSNNIVQAICEDSYGFIWIGTDDGLNRYNPSTNKFKQYLNDPKRPNSISHDHIFKIYESSNKELWILTRGGGLNLYNREKDCFKRISPNNLIVNNIIFNYTYSIVEGRKKFAGKFILGTEFGLFLFDPVTLNFTKIFNEPSLNKAAIYQLFFDQDENLWIGTWSFGLYMYNMKTDKLENFESVFKNKSFNRRIILSITEDNDNNLWVGTREGLLKKHHDSNIFEEFTRDPNNPYTISDNIINSIYADKSGILWIGTEFGGLSKVNMRSKRFFNMQNAPDNPNSLGENMVRSIFEDSEGILWIGTYNKGINIINRKAGTNQHLSHAENNEFPDNAILKIIEDNHNNIWIGSDGGGLTEYNKTTRTIHKYLYKGNAENNISNDYIYSLVADDQNSLWIGSWGALYGGLDRFDIKTNKFYSYSFIPENPTCLKTKIVQCLTIDHNKNLWIGSKGGGLSTIDIHSNPLPDPKTAVFKNYSYHINDKNCLSNNNVLCIYEDKENIIWIGTGGGGLNKFDPATQKFEHYTQKDGLANDVIYGILEDNSGNLWMSTSSGISKFDKDKQVFRNFDKTDGLLSNGYIFGSYFKNKKGEMFFGSVNGLTYFMPEYIFENNSSPVVKITGFRIFNNTIQPGIPYNGRVLLTKSITETSELKLSYKDVMFTFEFASLDFSSPEKNRYSYMLEGFDQEWIKTSSSQRFATYMNLKPGKYKFKVRASNSDGYWNNTPVEISVVIVPPFWRRIWFFVVIILIFIAGLMIFLRYRNMQIKSDVTILEDKVRERTKEIEDQKIEIEHQKNELEKLNQTKNKLFSIIAHDLKNPFFAIFNLVDHFTKNYQDLSEENRNEITKLIDLSARNTFDLLENLLSWARSQTGSISFNPENIDLVKLAEETINLVKPMAANKNITISLIQDKPVIAFIDKNMVLTVVRNLSNNAIKFTPDQGRLDLIVDLKADKAIISVRDSGIGIRPEVLKDIFELEKIKSSSGTMGESGTGLGLVISKEFIERNKGEISVTSTPGKGSSFTISFPLSMESNPL